MSGTDLGAIPVIVASRRQDEVEAVSRTLRNAGMAAHCRWVSQSKDLAAAFQEVEADLLVVFTDDSLPLDLMIKLRDSRAADVSTIVVQDDAGEAAIGEAMQRGAQDLVSMDSVNRLQAVARREIVATRRARELKRAEVSADQVRDALENMVAESPDAMLHVQEGIIVAVNPAWLELFGYADADGLLGTPVMDLFDAESQTAIKGALVACAEGKWTDHTLKSRVTSSDGSTLTVETTLEAAVLNDEPAVRIEMQATTDRAEELEERLSHVTERHPMTGFFRRQRFLESLRERLSEETKGGVVVLAYVKPDNFTAVRDQVGPIESDDLLLQFAHILEEIAKPNDVYGQFGGDMFMVLLARGAMRDAEAWAENLRARTAKSVFEAAGKSLAVTCTIGLAQYDSAKDDLSTLVIAAQKANLRGRETGGDRVVVQEREAQQQAKQADDQVPLQAIKQALMADSFRLVFQPVASLQGKSQHMFDVLVRMLDENNREVLPGQFLPVAARHGLMKNIDRWVIANAIGFCAEQNPTHLFIRLSSESLPDTTLAPWLAQQIAARG
ncbi:MAG: diguanylate cyclase, partial [Pseudomonadota bacterium]